LWLLYHAIAIGLGLRWRRPWTRQREPRRRPVFSVAADLRYTVRALRRAPWYSSTVIGVMALGAALATTIFAVVDGVLFKPIPLPASDRLFSVRPGFAGLPPRPGSASASAKDLRDWAAAAPAVSFTGFTAQRWGGFGEGVNDDAAGAARVQPNVFEVLGVYPAIGGFAREDFERETRMYPVIIRDDVWRRRFHGDPNVVGQTVEVDRFAHVGFRVVGVMPPGFIFPTELTDVKFLIPFVETGNTRDDPRQRAFAEVIARASTSVAPQALSARVETGMSTTAGSFPPLGPKPAGWSDAGWRRQGPYDRADVRPLTQTLGSRSRPLFRVVFLAVLLLLALGAVNVSGLMVARTLDRQREIGVRRALGASSLAITRLVLIESFVLVGAGAAAGLAMTPWLLRVALSLLPDEVVLMKTPSIDWRVLMFVIASVVVFAVPAAVWPIRRALRSGGALGHDDPARASARHRSVGRFVVVSAQVAAGFVLTLAGSLLVGSLLFVYANELPIAIDRTVLLEAFVQGPGATMQTSRERAARVASIVQRVSAVPGVGGVAVTSGQILRGGSWGSPFKSPPGARPLPTPDIDVQGVTSEYFELMRPALVAGRLPMKEELRQNERVLVVSEGLARAYWPNMSAVGQILVDAQDPEPYRVIGVVRDVRWYAWDTETVSIYGPYALVSRAPSVTLFIRSVGPAAAAQVQAEAIRAISQADPLLSIKRAATLDDIFRDSVRARRFQSWLFGSFAVAGLAVVGVGLLGLLAMATSRRWKEVGIRHALGSTPRRTVRLILGEQLIPVAVGLIGGALISVWTVTLVQKFLYGITPHDPYAWIIAAALIAATALLGSLVPAYRASRVDPVKALRVE
jgi:predicted permease